MEVLGGFAAQGLQRLLCVCPLQHQPAAVQVGAVAQGLEGFLHNSKRKKKKKEIKGENKNRLTGRKGRNVAPSAPGWKGHQRTSYWECFALMGQDPSPSEAQTQSFIFPALAAQHIPITTAAGSAPGGQAGTQHRECCSLCSSGWDPATAQHPVLCWNTAQL